MVRVIEHGEVVEVVRPDGVAVVAPLYDYGRNPGLGYRELDPHLEERIDVWLSPAARWLPRDEDRFHLLASKLRGTR